jgi:hypothetical protein
VTVLDARTGAILSTIPVGVDPVAVAVDERTGHVLGLSSGGSLAVPDPWGLAPHVAAAAMAVPAARCGSHPPRARPRDRPRRRPLADAMVVCAFCL